jgi:hypothetical protein
MFFDGTLVNGTANGQIQIKFEVGTSAKFDLGLDLNYLIIRCRL